LFRENNIDYEKVNYFIEPLTEDKLRELLAKANLSPFDVVRKSEAVYKELKVSEIKDADALVKVIVENPSILQRPIVEIGEKALLARPIEKAFELITAENRL
jgi:arsenate reductase